MRTEMVEVDPNEHKKVSARQVNQMIDSNDLEKVVKFSKGLQEVYSEEDIVKGLKSMVLENKSNIENVANEIEKLTNSVDEKESEVNRIQNAIDEYDRMVNEADPE